MTDPRELLRRRLSHHFQNTASDRFKVWAWLFALSHGRRPRYGSTGWTRVDGSVENIRTWFVPRLKR